MVHGVKNLYKRDIIFINKCITEDGVLKFGES